ncbi:MAG: amidohydrolase [Saprospiraceae bacterium]|nr:amidohydrolase [Saprospiraceae bacterium]
MLNTIQLRHQIHAHPELSGQESWTSAFIVEQLKKLGVTKIHTGFSQYSIVAEIDGQKAGKTLLFRCEIDALPIQETNTFAHRSTITGISHKCGHDGHTATMLAFAEKLIQYPLSNGKVLLLFQSAEETGAGAKAAIESGFFKQFSIDYAFAYHNLPSFPLGSVLCKEGIFTPSVESFCVELLGKPCHASQPANGINPADTVAQFIQFMAQFHQPDKAKADYFVVTLIHVHMGEKAYGTSASHAEIGYTIRTWESSILEHYKEKITAFIEEICQKERLEHHISWFESFKSNNNHPNAFANIKAVSAKKDIAFIEIEQPFDFGEDFGLFTDTYKGAMFGIGSGEDCPALHTIDYDFPDELIEIGSDVFMELVHELV